MTVDARMMTGGASADDRALLDLFYRAFAGEPDLLDEVVAPDWRDMPAAPGQGPGPEGVKPMIRGFKEAVPDLAITVHDVMRDGDRLGVRAEITGTHAGDLFGVAPTGRAFTVALHEFHRVADGRLTHTWHLEDWFGWLRQVDAWPMDKEDAS